MKYINIFFIILLFFFVVFPSNAHAQLHCNEYVPCNQSFFDQTCPQACTQKKQSGQQCTCITRSSTNKTNPLIIGNNEINNNENYTVESPVPFNSIGEIVSKLLPYIFVIAGLILFGLLIINGFKFLTSGGNPKATEGAKSGLTAALIGFIIIFISFWIIQLLQVVLQINILGKP